MKKEIKINNITIGGEKIVLIAGPCAIENEDMALETAEKLANITSKLNIPYIFKGSYDKANRLSINSGRGLGFPRGLGVLRKIRETFNIPVLTDVHETYQVEAVASVVDIIQIPAFLCRQTDLVLAAASTGKPINIKKGQFMAPEDMKYIAQKAEYKGNKNIMITERGTSFGYHDLVLDPRSIVILKSLGYPVILDITHSAQKPGGIAGASGGERKFVIPFGKVGVALGVDGIYMEVHPAPEKAISDKFIQVPLDEAENYIKAIFNI